MKHLDITATERGTHDREWLRLGAQIGQVVNEWSGRNDLVASVSSEGGSGAPACYKPQLAEIEINKEMVFGQFATPENIGDFTERTTQYEWAKATGAVIHEAFHAKFSGMDLQKLSTELSSKELQALILLEEGRIESLGVDDDKDSRVFLRACAMDIVLTEARSGISGSTLNIAGASTLVGLVYGRVLNDILLVSEVRDVLKAIDDVLGTDVVKQLVSICEKFQDITNTSERSVEMMKELAREWVAIVSKLQEEKGENSEESEDGEGGTAGGSGVSLGELFEKMEEISSDVEITTFSELDNQQREQEWKESSKEKSKFGKEREKSASVADKVFGSPTPSDESGASTGELAGTSPTNSTIVSVRPPNAQERVASVIISAELERAKYRERDITEVASLIPAGKLNTKVALQAKAEESKGRVSTLPAWRKKVRKQTDEPTLSVGIMCDISGSMGEAMAPMATTAWVMSEATKRVQGKVAMVYYGNSVFPALRAGQTLSDVITYSATDGTEKFDLAFMALNGELNLLDGNGARLLVVVSDGIYTNEETERATYWLNRCKESGVAVLWLPFSETPYYSQNLCRNTGAVVLPNVKSTIASATEIGRVSCEILSKTY